MEETEFAKVVDNVCRHPSMFTPNGTVAEVMSFLEGFAMGAQVGGAKNRNCHSKLTPFRRWCERRGTEVLIGSDTVSANGFDSLDQFARLYSEYAEQTASPNATQR